jgi:hypothetical protein
MDRKIQDHSERLHTYPEVCLPREIEYRDIVISRAIRKAEAKRRKRIYLGIGTIFTITCLWVYIVSEVL